MPRETFLPLSFRSFFKSLARFLGVTITWDLETTGPDGKWFTSDCGYHSEQEARRRVSHILSYHHLNADKGWRFYHHQKAWRPVWKITIRGWSTDPIEYPEMKPKERKGRE